jgi:hypothetical protein
MKKIFLQTLPVLLVISSSSLPLSAEDSVCVQYSKKMNECMKKEFAATCKKKPTCSMCQSVNPSEEMKKSMEESYTSMPCDGEFKQKSEKNLKLTCARDKYIQDSLKSMKMSMKSMPDCK